MKGRPRALAKRLGVLALTLIIGLAGGRVAAAAWMFQKIGWTATWLEISSWGIRSDAEPISRRTI